MNIQMIAFTEKGYRLAEELRSPDISDAKLYLSAHRSSSGSATVLY